MFDVAVIGGNLAGASAAINAVQKGVSVVLIERNKEPYFPPHCGEGTTDIEAKWLGLDTIKCKKNEIKTIKINIASSKEYTFKLKHHRLIIFDRNYLEKQLLKKVGQQGVKLILGNSLQDFNPPNEIILENHNKIKGRVIIDASGIACQVGRRIGIDTKLNPRDIGICIQSRVQSDFTADTMKMWFHKPYAPFGYAWLFPLNNTLANIGLGIPGGQNVDIAKLLDAYIKSITYGGHKINSTFKACVPSAAPLTRLIKDNVLIVGDAARIAHPLSGSGIGNAYFSGSIAGILAAKFINGEIPSLAAYQDVMQYKIAKLGKEYNKKVKIFENEKRFIHTYNRDWLMLWLMNKLFPRFLENRVAKVIRKDKSILESYK